MVNNERGIMQVQAIGQCCECGGPVFDPFDADCSHHHEPATKDYNVKYGIGKARYVVNFHDGVKTHADGSPFYDIHIANNKRDLNAFITELQRSGYTER